MARTHTTKAAHPAKGHSEEAVTGAGLPRRHIGRFGWVRDLPDHRDQFYSVSVATLTSLPKAVDLRSQCPPVYDQGRIGSCTANAIAGAIQFDRKKNKEPPDFVPSRLFIYFNERSIEHDVSYDRGAQLRDGIKAVNKLGVCPESEWPYDDTPAATDGGPFPPGSKAATRPPASAFKDAAKYKVVGYQRLVQTLSQLKGCLAEGFPFVFGFTVYSSFFQGASQDGSMPKQKVEIPLPSQNDTPLGGHAVMGVGYDDAKLHFSCRNSWGTQEGDGGYFYMPYSYLTDPQLASDFWVIQAVAH
jgi:C1A family cysteine protease